MAVPAPYGRGEALLFAVTLFLSAFLLFMVQPMFAKMALPLLGGASAVWNACLVFFQAALLAGYVYAHFSLKWLGPRRQAVLHLVLLGLAWLVLPIRAAEGWLPPATTFPAPWLWMLLTVSLGLPFFALSASAPMLQAWFARIGPPDAAVPSASSARMLEQPGHAGRDPYFLYAASNLGSLLALLAYPLVIEATAALSIQSIAWAVGYGLLMALVAACAVRLWRSPAYERGSYARRDPLSPAHALEDEQAMLDRPTLRRRLHWLALSLVPSSLLLGVTTYISSEITPQPFLWVLPLALYLLTFVLVFAPRTIVPLRWMVRCQPILIVVTAATLLWSGAGVLEVVLLGSLHLATFFVTAMVCHGQLAADRPAAKHLTEFYMWMSLGGVLGGLFSALVAPLIFSSVLEYPLMLAVACILRPRPVGAVRRLQRQEALPATALLASLVMAWGLRGGSFLSGWRFADGIAMRLSVVLVAAFTAFLLRRRPAVFGTAVAVLAAISLWLVETGNQLLDAERCFFGILRVEYDPVWNRHILQNGTTLHGTQSLGESQRHEPQGYYHRTGPLGAIFESLRRTIPRRPLADVGILGLGAGTIAAYAEPGERFTFYEIDPTVERIARNPAYFTYLADSRGTAEVILGDARISLVHGPERKFDLLLIDVFSSDAVPVHLLTREAMKIYFDHLKPSGMLAIHISSRYFNLAPIIGKLADEAGWTARVWRDARREGVLERTSSEWVAMARRPEDLGPLTDDDRWHLLEISQAAVWTDEFSNVAGALAWRFQKLHLIPEKWTKSNQAELHAEMARALLKEGRINEAIEHLQKSLEIEPNQADLHGALGMALLLQGSVDQAMEHWQKSLEIDLNNNKIQFSLGSAFLSRGRIDEAIQHLEEAVRLDPDHAMAHHDLGVALAKKGRKDEAVEHLLRAVQIEPGYADAFHDLGKVLLDEQKNDQAEGCFRKAMAIKPADAEIRSDLGRALKKQGKIQEAIAELRRALQLADQKTEFDNADLVEKIKAEIRRCEAWPWDEETTDHKP
jgi:tetratricopeptide (TPR) repeat protein